MLRRRPVELRLDPLDVVRAERGDKSDRERLKKQRQRIRQREREILEWDAAAGVVGNDTDDGVMLTSIDDCMGDHNYFDER